MSDHSSYWQEIESEHGGIIRALNRARMIAVHSERSMDSIISAYEAIVREFENHFAHEERIMAETLYPDADAHRRHHKVLLIRLLAILEEMRSSRTADFEKLRLVFKSFLDDAIDADESLRSHLERLVPHA